MSTPWLGIVTTTSVGGNLLSIGGSETTTVGICGVCKTKLLIAASPSNTMNKSLTSFKENRTMKVSMRGHPNCCKQAISLIMGYWSGSQKKFLALGLPDWGAHHGVRRKFPDLVRWIVIRGWEDFEQAIAEVQCPRRP